MGIISAVTKVTDLKPINQKKKGRKKYGPV
jgi:hypothetical protein